MFTNAGWVWAVATHQKTQQGLKQLVKDARTDNEDVATHQKTQQGLKLCLTGFGLIGGMYVATHQKTQQGLKPAQQTIYGGFGTSQRIRKPNRD